jgi:hypothetical protein
VDALFWIIVGCALYATVECAIHIMYERAADKRQPRHIGGYPSDDRVVTQLPRLDRPPPQDTDG